MLGKLVMQSPMASKEVLRVENLEVSSNGIATCRNLNFSLQFGELRFLVGPSGAGRTILDVISGKVRPSQGHVFFKNSIDLTKHPEHQIAQLGVGRKFHTPSIFEKLTIFENLALSMKQQRGLLSALWVKTTSEQRERLLYRLEIIGLQSKAKQPASALSYSDKQRLEIGMLLMQEPDLLLLDEPAVGMNEEEAGQIGDLLHEISRNQTIVVAEQGDVNFVRRFAKTITVLHENVPHCEQNNNQQIES